MVLFLVLVLTGTLLVVAELFLPGGIVGSIGLLLLACSVVVAYLVFERGTANTVLIAALFALAAGIWWWLKIFPHSRFADRVVVRSTVETPDHGLDHLLGKRGTVSSPLRPAGTAEIAGSWVDVVTEGSFLAVGSQVEVILVHGNRVVVRSVRPSA